MSDLFFPRDGTTFTLREGKGKRSLSHVIDTKSKSKLKPKCCYRHTRSSSNVSQTKIRSK
ncbi:hypothetical protein CPC197_1246, partial [Chlamydia psittaci C1/97]